MAEKIKNGLWVVVGWGLVLIGLVGLLLPLLQGVFLIALGLFVLSKKDERIAKWIVHLRKNFPVLDKALSFFTPHKNRS